MQPKQSLPPPPSNTLHSPNISEPPKDSLLLPGTCSTTFHDCIPQHFSVTSVITSKSFKYFCHFCHRDYIPHKPYIQRNYIPVASVKQVFKKETPILLTCIRLFQNNTMSNEPFLQPGVTDQTFCKYSTYSSISTQYSLFSTRIVRILGIIFCPLSSANLCEITTDVVCIEFNFVPCYSSVIIQQQFLTPSTKM